MKNLLIIVFLFVSNLSYGQWVAKTINNNLDEPYKIAYCLSTNKKAILKLELVGTQLAFYMTGSYFCDEELSVDVALIVNGESKRYQFLSSKSSDNTTVFLVDDILSLVQQEFLADFKKCSSAIVRVNESHCTTDIFNFTMSGSTNAINVMSKP
jgi:hypothetical protein